MSNVEDYEYDDDDNQPEQPRQNPLRARMKQLEKENAEKEQALAEALNAKRELTFLKAGINPDEAKFKYFVKAYDGELAPDAIRQAAIEAQLMSPPNQIGNDETGAWSRTDQVAAGTHVTTPEPDLITRINRAKSEQEIMDILAEAQAQL